MQFDDFTTVAFLLTAHCSDALDGLLNLRIAWQEQQNVVVFSIDCQDFPDESSSNLVQLLVSNGTLLDQVDLSPTDRNGCLCELSKCIQIVDLLIVTTLICNTDLWAWVAALHELLSQVTSNLEILLVFRAGESTFTVFLGFNLGELLHVKVLLV